jgi:prepilin-type processing-associated H-X9-DG protein
MRPVFGESLEDVLASYEAKGFTIDRDPDDRTGDRGLARIGELEDALPLFADRANLRQGGVLLAIPLLVESGLLDMFVHVYHSLAPAFYGLRTTVVVLFLSALLRIKRPENLKEYNPQELGHLVGLDRFPEVKTVRRKLEQLAARRGARELMRAMAQRRVEKDPDRVAFLYVDGHVREYHGHHPLAKTKKSQRQVAKPAATDNWVHDANGEPLLVVTSEMNESLTQVLEPILADVKELVGERRPLVIFDRGGYSPKLFARLDKLGFDVMTYRKGKIKPWPVSQFSEEEYVVDGRRYRYRLAERKRVKVGRLRPRRNKESSAFGPQFLWMRELRVLRADGHQTAILTSGKQLEKVEVPYRQFNRWRQENYFKYMDAEYELDALLEYGVEDVSEEVDRPNPCRGPLERELTAARARVQRLQAQLGAAMGADGTSRQRTVRGFKIAHAELRAELAEAEDEVARLRAQLDAMPRRIPADDLKTLKTEKKLIADTIKMTAYQVETRLLAMLKENYCRTEDEGRTLLQAAFQSTARVEVKEEELYVELAPQSSPHRTKAIGALCADLNTLGAKFPGTCLRLHLAIQPHEPLTNP